MFEEQVVKILETAGIKTNAEKLETPPQEEFGDLSFPCFELAKKQKRNPAEIANKIASKIKIPKGFAIERVEVEGAYVNFFFNSSKLSQKVLKEILNKKENYGRGNQKQKIMIEFSGPNTNKPLHVGHLRNDSIGMSVSNILEFSGNHVIRTNIINDRGVHICKSMLAYQKWGDGRTPEKENKKGDHFVGDFYVMFERELKEDPSLEEEIHKMLKKWEEGDKEVRKLWKKMNGWTIGGIKETYKLFGSRFDLWPLESEFYDKAKPVIEEGLRKGVIFKNEDGDVAAKLEPELPNKVVIRSDGTTVYITNDIALTKHRFEKYNIDKCIWVVATEQNLHFKQLFKIFELLGYKWAKNCYHLSYGLVNLPSGRMKTREGNVVDADDLIKEETELAKQEILNREKKISKKELESRALRIALAAIKYYLLKVEPIKDVLFDPNRAISFEGDTGPYIQYAYTRCASILRKAKKWKQTFSNKFIQPEEKKLIKMLSRFPSIVNQASAELKPNYICNYSYDLATAFNNFYEKYRVINAETSELKSFRLDLVKTTQIILGKCLELMGVYTVEKM